MRKNFILYSFLYAALGYLIIGWCGCDPPPGGGGNDPCTPANMQFETISITLRKEFKSAPNRNLSYPPPQTPHMWTGNDPSLTVYPTNGLHGAYYCVVRLESRDCQYFKEEYVWNTTQSSMNISVPSNFSFNVKVVYFEVCGVFYNNSYVSYETEWNWVSIEYKHTPPKIDATTFSYVARKQCN